MKRTIMLDISDKLTISNLITGAGGADSTSGNFDELFNLDEMSREVKKIGTDGDLQEARYILDKDRALHLEGE